MNELQFQRYMKFIVAIIGALITTALTLWTDGDVQKWLIIANAGITAIGVYQIPNSTRTPAPELSVKEPGA